MNLIITPFLLSKHTSRSPLIETIFSALETCHLNGSTCLDLEEFSRENNLSLLEIKNALAVNEENSVVGSAGEIRPLILAQSSLLYFQKYFTYELFIASKLLKHTKNSLPIPLIDAPTLENLFPNTSDTEKPQREAAEKTIKNNLLILTGGPGTGKTTTVTKVLAALAIHECYQSADQVCLLAPTGKAANRLSQSIHSGVQLLKNNTAIKDDIISLIPTAASTIHRAIKLPPALKAPKYTAENPLPYKVFIIDEVSMVDLSLLYLLFQAIPPDTKIILIGDPNQLSSVQVGTILGDLVKEAFYANSVLQYYHIHLTHTFRNSGQIKAACDALCNASSKSFIKTLTLPNSNVSLAQLPTSPYTALKPIVEKYWLPILNNSSLSTKEKLAKCEEFKILTPLNNGKYGVHSLNQTIEKILTENGIKSSHDLYEGKAILVTKNQSDLNIYNGDTGMIHYDDASSNHSVVFQDGTQNIPFNLIEQFQTAWALTIHKTQGSEYNNILILCDSHESAQNIYTKELLYTAISRAKENVILWADLNTLENMAKKTINRASGLTEQFK